MSEFAREEYERRLSNVPLVRAAFSGPEAYEYCDCRKDDPEQQAALLGLAQAGDEAALERLLGYYAGCIERWSEEVSNTAAGRVAAKAQLAVAIGARLGALTAENFSTEFHVAMVDTAEALFRDMLERHRQQEAAQAWTLGAETAQPELNPAQSASMLF